MKTLFIKEIRALLPFLAMVLMLYGTEIIFQFLLERPDELTWAGQRENLLTGNGHLSAFLILIFGLSAAYSVFPREHDEGTIQFLYALPVSRRSIFLAKALAAWSVVALMAVLDQVNALLLTIWNTQSLGGEQWRFFLAFQVCLLESYFCALVVAHGLLMSFLRRLGLLAYGVLALFVGLIIDFQPQWDFLDPATLLSLNYNGTDLVLPWGNLALHGSVALVAFGLAYALWMGAAERFNRLYRWFSEQILGKATLGCATVAIVVLGTTAFFIVFDDDSVNDEPVRYPSLFPVRGETLHYDFNYNSHASQRARTLMAVADDAYTDVAGLLGATDGPRIDADLTDPGSAHLGIAQGGVLRVALENLSDLDALRTLYHETAHVFQHHLSDGKAASAGNSLRFFIEGSAEWVTAELLEEKDGGEDHRQRRQAHRRLAATAYHLHQIRFEEMLDDTAFRRLHDPLLAYTLGEAFTAGLAEACGRDIPGKIFRMIDREDAPEDLSGLVLWQDLTGAADCDLESAIAAYERIMTRTVREEWDFIRSLPRLGGGIVGFENGRLIFKASPDRYVEAPAESYYLSVRRDPGVDENGMVTFNGEYDPENDTITFRLPGSWAGSPFEYQIGQSIEGSLWAFFEDWQTATP